MKKFELKENTHVVFKVEDAKKYLKGIDLANLEALVEMIDTARIRAGKKSNEYYVINKDEPYAKEIFDVIKNGEIAKEVKR